MSAGTPDDLRARLRRSRVDERQGWHVNPVGGSAPAESGSAVSAHAFKAKLQARVLDEIAERGLFSASDDEVAEAVRDFGQVLLAEEALPLNEVERERLLSELVDETLGLGPLAPLMADPAVTDVLVNAPDVVFVERFGRLESSSVRFHDDDHLLRVIERIASRVGRRIDAASPMADLRLPDGSRVNATIPPASPDGPTLSIRRFGRRRLTIGELVELGTLSAPLARFLEVAVRHRCGIL